MKLVAYQRHVTTQRPRKWDPPHSTSSRLSGLFRLSGMSVDHPGLGSWGRRRVIGPQESILGASAAWAEWNP